MTELEKLKNADLQLYHERVEDLRVVEMTPAERRKWLEEDWDPLQREAENVYRHMNIPPGVKHFATMEEKNAYDEQLEIECLKKNCQEIIDQCPEFKSRIEANTYPNSSR